MNKTQGQPWSFIVEFDEQKAEKNGYSLDVLYDYVARCVEQYGVTRVARGTWKAQNGKEVESQCLALVMLSEIKVVMQNIKTLTVFEDNTEPIDCLEVFGNIVIPSA